MNRRPSAGFGLAPQILGTYALVTTEVKDPATGKWSQTPNFNSNGYIIYSNTGQMAVQIMPKIRERPPMPMTGEGTLKAMQGYVAYFGTFTVDDKNTFVVHHLVGQINPGGEVDRKPADGPGTKARSRRLWKRSRGASISSPETC